MRRKFAHNLVFLLILLSVFLLSPSTIQGQEQAPINFDISYSERGQEVLEVQLSNEMVNPDGSISADVTLVAKTWLTYGFLLSVENGTVTGESGSAIETFLRIQSRAIPLFGKWSMPVGRATFSSGAHLMIRLNKVQLVPGDAQMLLGLDAVTAFLLFTGIGGIPEKPADLIPDIVEGFVELLDNVGFDSIVFTNQLRTEDWIGALRTLAGMFVDEPEIFANYLFSEFGLRVSAETVRNFGTLAGRTLPIVGVFPLTRDLLRRPRAAQVDIRAFNPEADDQADSNCPAASGAAALDNLAPDFQTLTNTGELIALSDFRGQIVLVTFWGTWAGFPDRDMLELQAIYEEFGEECFIILAVNLGEPVQTVTSFRQELGLTFPLLMDEQGAIEELYAVSVYPSSYLLNREGVIISEYLGPLTSQQIQEIREIASKE